MFSRVFTTILAAAAVVSAASVPATRATLDVWDLPVTKPTTGDVWHAGEKQVVTWDTSSLPSTASNQTGMILLGYYTPGDNSGNEHLDTGMFLSTSALFWDCALIS